MYEVIETKALHIGSVMPSSCLFNGQRRAVIKQTESFYFFAVGNSFKWNYAEKHLCTDFN
tara:strand:+ start:51 stop:230 length:180 start_codon:yes stop_codon:yes gene_type:complete